MHVVRGSPSLQKHQFLTLSLLYGPPLIFVYDYWKNHSFDYMDLCRQVMSLLFNMLSRFGKVETVADFIFLVSKITVDGD